MNSFLTFLSFLSFVQLHPSCGRSSSTWLTSTPACEVVVACIARDFHFFVVEVNVEVCAIVKSDIARKAQPEFVFAGLYCTFFGCQFEVVGGAGVFGDSMLTDPFRKQLTSFFFFFFRRDFVIRQQLGGSLEKLLFLLFLSVHVGFAVFYSFKGKHFNFMGMGHLRV
jgi:hypothetical protein